VVGRGMIIPFFKQSKPYSTPPLNWPHLHFVSRRNQVIM
jgi:hypothetical protein